MTARIIFLSFVICTLIGCTPVDSINPLFTSKDITFDRGLLGMWGDKDTSPQDGYLLFEKGDDNGYRITMVDDNGSRQEFSGHLGYVHGQRFLDVAPVPSAEQWSALADADLTINRQAPNAPLFKPAMVRLGDAMYLEFSDAGSDANQAHFKVNLRAAHWFCKIATEGSVMHLDCLDEDWAKKYVGDGSVYLDHESSSADGSGLVITASTTDLQKFVTEHVDDKEAFSWSMTASHLRQ